MNSILGFLLVLFIALKVIGVAPVAAWSWWLVLTPLWVWIALALVFFGLYALALRKF